jgi:cytochrome c biogenesis protein CcmG/thiol:disulfide interchange protein DsbE
MTEPQNKDAPAKPKRWMLLVPLAVALLIGAFLFNGLSLNPREIPSALIGKPAPEFDLPAITDRPPGLKTADLKGQVSLVNVFASWCVACRVEHPVLMDIQAEGDVSLHGLNYKDKPKAALAWLGRFGDPYGRVGADEKGRVGIDFGVYGVPETFLIDKNGQIACKHIGPIDRERDWIGKLKPAVAALRAGKAPKC